MRRAHQHRHCRSPPQKRHRATRASPRRINEEQISTRASRRQHREIDNVAHPAGRPAPIRSDQIRSRDSVSSNQTSVAPKKTPYRQHTHTYSTAMHSAAQHTIAHHPIRQAALDSEPRRCHGAAPLPWMRHATSFSRTRRVARIHQCNKHERAVACAHSTATAIASAAAAAAAAASKQASKQARTQAIAKQHAVCRVCAGGRVRGRACVRARVPHWLPRTDAPSPRMRLPPRTP